MTEYLDIEFEGDPDALAQDAFAYLQSVIPNWNPAEGNLDVWILRATARNAAEVQEIASTVPTTIFRYAGANLFGILPIEATMAQGASTWTMVDTAGYTIPEGTLVGVKVAGDLLIPFRTLVDVVVAPGSSVTAAGEVILEAVNPGADGSGLSGAVDLIDSLSFVASIVLVGLTTGGIDAEEDDVYLNRLRLQLQLLAPRPIVPSDFSAMALDIPGIHRALAIDGYDPGTGTTDNERTITVVPVDENGDAVDAGTKASLLAFLESHREVNFLIYVIDPTVNSVDVTTDVQALPGFLVTDVQDNVAAALANNIDPSVWGLPPTGDSLEWINTPSLRYLDVAAIIKSVQGVAFINTLSIGLHLGTMGQTDVPLAGAAPMATLGTVTVTVTTA